MKLRVLLPTLWRLGLPNLARMASYRLALKSGQLAKRLPAAPPIQGPFLSPVEAVPGTVLTAAMQGELNAEAQALGIGRLRYFSNFSFEVGSPPAWFHDPFTGLDAPNPQRHWTRIGDFEAGSGDIKAIWEPSRLEWALTLARAERTFPEEGSAARLEAWLVDWASQNPPQVGPNWKCGQEASLRLMHLLLAAWICRPGGEPTLGLRELIDAHARRIVPSMGYAVAQDNNHGTSEAAALFIAGAWLGVPQWERMGRERLEERVARLLAPSGTFAQASVTYHRMVLDTLAQAEFWRRQLGRPAFSKSFQARAAAAARWLHRLTDPETGDAPNVGPNDGTYPFRLASMPYRDFRPSVQLASALWLNARAYPEGPWDEPLLWLEITPGEGLPPSRGSLDLDGFVVRGNASTWALLRTPQGRSRPTQADALHLDFWHQGKALLRDGGTYSYRASAVDFASTQAHNTVQLDSRDQMPRLGRFLYGLWLHARLVGPETWGYTDAFGGSHTRRLQFSDRRWTITDTVSGFKKEAVLRWRLAPGEWTLENGVCRRAGVSLMVSADRNIDLRLVGGSESLHYMEATSVSVLEAAATEGPITFTTIIELS